jgi:hypothetical protein
MTSTPQDKFCTKHGIYFAKSPVKSKPKDPVWARELDYWDVTLKRKYTYMRVKVYFPKEETPSAGDILVSMAADLISTECGLEEWAINLGLDAENYETKYLFKYYHKQSIQLKQFLGKDLLEELQKLK